MRKLRTVVLILVGIVLALIASQIRFDLAVKELKAKYANAASKFLSINDANVHYRDEGSGPILVLLHGTGASLHTWDGWTKELQADFRVVRMDLPGFGLTGPDSSHDYSMKHYGDLLAVFLDSLRLDRIHLAGNSLGGRIAWHFALAHPERLERMVLLDAGGYPTAREPFALKLARNPLTRALARWITPRSLIEKSLLEVYGDDGKVTAELVQRYYDLTRRAGNRAAFIAGANTAYDAEFERLKHLATPTLIQWGAEDTWIPVADAHRFDADIPNSELIIYEGAGHVPMEEIPERTARDAKIFLSVQPRLDRGLY